MSLAPEPGRSLGRYELMRRLATGGMAEIYLARVAGAAVADRQLVVKRMLPDLARDPAFIEMFLAEARITSRLAHPNIVRIDEIGVDRGDYFYAMEYVRGADLHDLMRVLWTQRKTIPIDCAVAIVIRVCSALEHAHALCDEHGRPLDIVHRDISLENILVGYDGSVKLTDFGVVQHEGRARTEPGILKGKFGYMSPEQCLGEPLDRRSDLFALGVVLYEITTGQRLFPPGETDEETLTRIFQCAITAPSAVRADYPLDLAAIVMTALQRDRAERYQNARDLRRDLQAFLRVHELAASRSEIGALVARVFPIASPRRRAHSTEGLDTLIGSLPPVPTVTRVAAVTPATAGPMEPATTVRWFAEPKGRIPELRFRPYLPVTLVLATVVLAIATSAWAWTYVQTPGATPVAVETSSPEIATSSMPSAEPAPAPAIQVAPPPAAPASRPRSSRSKKLAPKVERPVTKPDPDLVVVEDEPITLPPAPAAAPPPSPRALPRFPLRHPRLRSRPARSMRCRRSRRSTSRVLSGPRSCGAVSSAR